MLTGTTFKNPRILTIIGILHAVINSIACLENIPEFFIEYFSKYIIPIKYSIYVYIVCIKKLSPNIVSLTFI